MFGASVKYSLPNADHLQEGLFWQAQTVVARSLGASGRWVPFAGLVAEHRNGYRKYDFLNEESAYSVAHGMAGMEYRGDRFSGGATLTIQFGSNTVQKKPPIMEHILCM